MGVNAALVVSAPNFALAAIASGSALGAGRAIIRLGNLATSPTAGQLKLVQNTLASGGRRGLEAALRKWERLLASHMKDLATYKQAGGPTSYVEGEIRNFQGLIQAAKQLLGIK